MPNERLINIGAPDRPLPPPAPTRSGGPRAIRVHVSDDVAVAIYALSPQQEIVIGGARVPVIEAVAPGHKIALRDIEPGEPVVKYGYPIGVATAPIELPSGVKGGGPAGAPAAAPAAPAAPPPARRNRPRGDASPIRINPIARSVSFDQAE